jgi:hypothetical protein
MAGHRTFRIHPIHIDLDQERDSSVGIATGYGLDGWGSTPGRGETFLYSTASKPALPPSQLSYPMGAGGGGDFPEVKAAEA